MLMVRQESELVVFLSFLVVCILLSDLFSGNGTIEPEEFKTFLESKSGGSFDMAEVSQV